MSNLGYSSPAGRSVSWSTVATVFAVVVAVQLALVANAGTDIPFYDQWDVEGVWLYPAWQAGQWHLGDLLRPMNEHRVAWTYLLDLGLFVVNGQWDPLLQLAAIAFLRAAIAAGVTAVVAPVVPKARWLTAAVVVVAFLPHLAWHGVLWGIESQVYFSIGFSLLALGLLAAEERSWPRTIGGLAAGGAAVLAMGSGALVGPTLLGWAAVRAAEGRRRPAALWSLLWPAFVLLAAAWALRVDVAAHAGLEAGSVGQFVAATGQLLSWPHVGQPWAALPLNLPLVAVVAGRILRRREPAKGENFVVLAAGWSIAVALATAWRRGGSDELLAGVPSRYVDFIVLLPLANLWCVSTLAAPLIARWRASGRVVVGAWCAFVLLGWLGLSAQMMRHIILPRMRDRNAPVRLIRDFQQRGDETVFQGQPRLLVPHPNLGVVNGVLHDPAMAGVLPPSLQPDRRVGPLSRALRGVLRR